jgi:hypothetical protein
MDSHMHLDRSLRRLRMDPRMGIQELLARRPRPAPKQEINVVGVWIKIAKIQSVLGMNSHCHKPSLGKISFSGFSGHVLGSQ